MTDRYQCAWCTSEYTSAWAAAECEETDRVDDLHARQQLRGRGKKPVATQ